MIRPAFVRAIHGALGIIAIASLLLAGCAGPAGPEVKQPVTLKIAVLRILDVLPMYVAEKQGYFEASGVKVEFIPVASAPERDQLIAAGQADGMVNEVMSTLFSNREQVNVQVVRIARAADPSNAVFRILAGKDSGVTSIEDMKKVSLGISQGTVIEYLVDRLLEAEGFNPQDFTLVSIPGIPDRLALLNSGELGAAVLPDPLSSLAIQGGAKVILDDSSHPEYGYSTIAFRKAVIDANPEAIKAFLAAIEKAVDDINANPGQWKDLLTEKELVPPPLLGAYQVPPFPKASVPSESQFQDALDWAKAKGLLDKDLNYADTILDAYLP